MTKTIKIKDKILHIVEVPEGNDDEMLIAGEWILFRHVKIHIPVDGFKGTFLYSKLTEEDASNLVEDCPYFCKCWKHYSPEMEYFLGLGWNNKISCWTALNSFKTLVKSMDLKGECLILIEKVV